MGVYLYCLGGDRQPVPGEVVGIEDAPVHALTLQGLTAWVSSMPAPPTASLERVRAHNAVVEAACRQVTPVPLRFGQWFPSDAELEASLQEREPALRSMLRRVEGAVEFGVRIVDLDPVAEPLDRRSGTAYLEALARRERRVEADRRRGQAVAEELGAWLGRLVRESQAHPLRDDGLVAIAHLVDRHDTGSYHARLSEFPARHPELRFVSSGPWPPYGFVE